MKIKLLFFILIFNSLYVVSQNNIQKNDFIFYPGSLSQWDYKFSIGLSLTRIPLEITEEEINTLPMINADFKMGMPKKFTLHAKLNSNYISNMISIAFQRNIIERRTVFGLGVNTSFWFGHIYQEVIRLNANGFIINPYIIGGYNFNNFNISCKLENQFSTMRTFSEDAILARSSQPNSAYSFQFIVEQPLWNNNWVAIGVKLNYAKFYYQAWLTYTAIDEYLLYPEYSFSFIF